MNRDATFTRLCDQYEQVNAELSQMEGGAKPVADHVERDMRKRRMVLEDEFAAHLRNPGH